MRHLLRLPWILGIAGALAVAGGCASGGAMTGPVAFPNARAVPADGGRRAASIAPVAPELADAVTRSALDLTGVDYRFGGEDPATGLDCSGLVRFVFARHQVDVPRTVAEQFDASRRIDIRDVQAGDLLFFSTIGPGATHVGIALGASAPGQFVHAPGTGSVVRVERYDTPYWQDRLIGARRVGA
jgi:cell wall-associated NlpC family hydrolase